MPAPVASSGYGADRQSGSPSGLVVEADDLPVEDGVGALHVGGAGLAELGKAPVDVANFTSSRRSGSSKGAGICRRSIGSTVRGGFQLADSASGPQDYHQDQNSTRR